MLLALRCFALALALPVALWLPTAAFAADAAPALRQSFDLQVPLAPTPVTMDGRRMLVYELHLTNFAGEALRPTRVEVRAPTQEAPLAVYAGDALTARLAPLAGAAAALAPGMRAVLYVEIEAAAATRALSHRVVFARGEAGGEDAVEGGHIAPAAATAPVLGAPLRGGPWAAIHHPSWPRGHRRVFYAVGGRARIPGRHAIDFVKLDTQGRSTRGDADVPGNAYGYGEAVLAVADAVVAAVRDDMRESARVSAHPRHALQDASGNYVALALGDGRYAFYEHLQPGSVRVAVGQRVRRGQAIAALGFTGDASGPHLHFHLADGATPLGAEGLPFAFARFDVLGRYADIAQLGQGPWSPSEGGAPQRRRDERPAPNTVLDFGDAPR